MQRAHEEEEAKALFLDFLPPDFPHLSASEPVTLVLTALALLSLARVGTSASRGSASDLRETPRPVAGPGLQPTHTHTSTKCAA